MYKLLPILKHLNACKPAKDWVRDAKARTARDLWRRCDQPGWMLWIFKAAIYAGGHAGASKKDIARIKKAHAELACAYWESIGTVFAVDLRAAVTLADLDALERVLVHYAREVGCLVKAE